MISSSPDYAITKPGMSHHLSRKRDKPLRTYGRKSTSTPEPPAKKARIESEYRTKSSPETLKRSKPEKADADASGAAETIAVVGQPSRSSILQYFQRVSTETERAKIDIKNTKENGTDKAESLASSQICRSRRKPRLLRLRAASPPSGHLENDACLSGGGKKKNNESLHTGKRKSLHEAEDNLLNQGTSDGTSLDVISGEATARSKRLPTVQTTLNISSKAAFAECKVCDTVWNPLYPDDVKYHDKQHRMVMKAKKRKEDDL